MLIAAESACPAYKASSMLQPDPLCPAAEPGDAMLTWYGLGPASLLRRMEA